MNKNVEHQALMRLTRMVGGDQPAAIRNAQYEIGHLMTEEERS